MCDTARGDPPAADYGPNPSRVRVANDGAVTITRDKFQVYHLSLAALRKRHPDMRFEER